MESRVWAEHNMGDTATNSDSKKEANLFPDVVRSSVYPISKWQ
ncbi:MAG TPA: hypothetical protein VJ905_11430 [Halalkalibaculum sp.]|nr:hypothetical protein [Halalkalibaculum sp.]